MYLDHNNLLSEQQYGFRANHSAELAAIKLADYIVHEIERKLTHVNIYIDLSKAFDTLNFDILVYKLHYYGITDGTLKLLKVICQTGNNMLNIMLMTLGLKTLKQARHRDQFWVLYSLVCILMTFRPSTLL